MPHISAPPPPPPLPSSINKTTPVASPKDRPSVINISGDECAWAWEYPELQKGCYLNRVCQYIPPKQCQYYSVASILQVGPTCGLTAVSMLLNGNPTAAHILEDAIAQEYTINGEMFSAQYLYELTRRHLHGHGPGACQLHEGRLCCNKVTELLRAGGCLLVPYPFSKFLILSRLLPITSAHNSTVCARGAAKLRTCFVVFFSAIS
ncbi:UPF0692 protein CG33108 isoform X1 [Drosophila persimilis]|uniref:UPF0692 protein CG33108 isoform X1 n=1 Tax=Drosophila persimilis TaxID=7234 RepID=UPI000F098CAF|nr:UPF0692 protein CG33108 isoform X1 [Drosophila persimilis]